MIYADTSVLAAYYFPEPLSARAERTLTAQPGPVVSDLVEVELFSAAARKVRRREVTRHDAGLALARFAEHLEAGLYTRVAIERPHYVMARTWISTFELPLRTLDALHLAVATSRQLQLVTADESLAGSAKALGIGVELLRARKKRERSAEHSRRD